MHKTLRKSEYESIIKAHYGCLPQVSQFKYYKACQKLFCELEIDRAHKYYLAELKKRNIIDVEAYSKIPYELKCVVYFSKFRKKNYRELDAFLKSIYGG